MKIVVLDGETLSMQDVSWEPLQKLGELTVHPHTPAAETVRRSMGFPYVFTNKTKLSAEIIAQLPELKFIGVLATGYDVVDVAAARQRDIPVCNVPDYGTDSVAQMTIALILEHFLAVGAHTLHVRQGGWQRHAHYSCPIQPLTELAGKTMGFIGFGRIGQRTADIAQAMGMNIVAYDVRPSDQSGRPCFRWVELDELYREADIISLHCFLDENNKGMINRASLAKMKPGALLVNTARGGLINEQDLLQALKDGHIGGAALDVLSLEPPSEGNILIGAPRVIITPHIAWATYEARKRLTQIAADNLAAYLNGQVVNCVY